MINLKSFTGEFPRTLPHLLPDTAAQLARDCDFAANALTGIRDKLAIAGINGAGVKSIYVHDDAAAHVFTWNRSVIALRGVIANDAYSRFYWLDAGTLYVSKGDVGSGEPGAGNKWKAGVPYPTVAPTQVTSNAFPVDTTGWSMTTFLEHADGTVSDERPLSVTLASNAPKLLQFIAAGWVDYSSSNGTKQTVSVGAAPGVGQSSSATGASFIAPGYEGSPSTEVFEEFSGAFPFTIIAATTVSWTAGMPATQGVNIYTPLSIRLADGQWVRLADIVKNGVDNPTGVITTNTSNSGATTLAVRYWSPTHGTSILRPVTNTAKPSTMSAEMAGFGGGIDAKADGLHVSLWVDPASTFIERRAYVYTYVNEWGEEGAPSLPLEVDVPEGAKVTFTIPAYANTDSYVTVPTIRIYRSATGSDATDYYFLADKVNPGTGDLTVSDESAGSNLGEPLSTLAFYPPPTGLENIVAMPNGMFLMSKGNQYWACQNYLPYAVRPQDTGTTLTNIVGMCPAEGGVYITTRSNPYFVSGMAPDALSQSKITAIQAGVSRHSICNIGQFVVYATNDGLCTARGVDVSMDFSFKFFTREEWRDRYKAKLDKLHLDAHDGNLVAWFEDGTPGFLVRTDMEDPSFTRLTDVITAAFTYPVGDALYVSNGTTVYEFKGATTRKAFEWQSKDFLLPKPYNFGACQVIGSCALTIKVYADGVLRKTTEVSPNADGRTIFRLPGGFLARRWSVNVVGSAGAQVTQLNLAGSPQEFANV